jgi:hypothetical protein
MLHTRAEQQTVEGVSTALEDHTALSVSAFHWEPSRGLVQDLILGRPILFEARATEDGSNSEGTSNRDIYRSFVRLSPEGKILDVTGAINLTRTRHSDERGLTGTGQVAMFWTETRSGAPSVSALDLRGEPTGPHHALLDKWQIALGRLFDTGTFRGLGRTDVVATRPDSQLSLSYQGTTWQLSAEIGSQLTTTSWKEGEPPRDSHPSLSVIARQREPIPWLHFLANSGRKLLGSSAVAWVEGRYFSLVDAAHQVVHGITNTDSPPPRRSPKEVVPVPLSRPRNAQAFPPADLVPTQPTASDGKWRALSSTLLPEKESPYFYRTVLHTDPERPYAELHLVIMDMRRLELGVGAGYEDPEPDSGPPGSGQIPDEPNVYMDVLATFNGAFKADHGRFGIKAEGRQLVEPRLGAATVVTDRQGRTGFGTWSNDQTEAEFEAFRQNLTPLVAAGRINPSGTKAWGDHLYGSGVAVERSALCLHQSGHIIYAWATEATGLSLASGLRAAGCVYAMHLDMNPGHCAFLLNKIASIVPLRAEGEVLDARMRVNPTRYVRWSPKDFFYVKRRQGLPKISTEQAAWAWRAAPGFGPAPRSVPAIVFGSQVLGGIPIELERIDPNRFEFALQVGAAEPNLNAVESTSLLADVLVAWGTGHATFGSRTGLSVGRQVIVPLRRDLSSLVLEKGELPKLLPPGEPLTEEEDRTVVQLKTLARDGKLLTETRELGGHRTRSALCILNDQTMYVGRMTHDSIAPLVAELLELGCSLVAEMDRGSHSPVLVERAGTGKPPHVGYDQSVLYAVSKEMKPRTFTF